MEEELLFEDDDYFKSLVASRMQEFQRQSSIVNKPVEDTTTFGYLSEIGHEKEVMHLSTSLPRLVIHFYSPTFKSCQLMNEHLKKLTQKYPRTRFVYIEATKAPFLVVKMQVQMLPCVVCIVDSIIADKMIGFDDLGGSEAFTTKQLEDRLASGSRIFQYFGKLKVSADRRDITTSSEDSDEE